MKLLLSCLLLFSTAFSYANTKFINIFVTVDKTADTEIKKINRSMDDADIYSKYNITPFLNDHLVHLTMYLTYYENDQIKNIIPKIKNIAKTRNKFEAKIKNIELKPSNFLMLNLVNNEQLQQLSDLIVANLYNLHSKNIEIPNYAKNDPIKIKLFEQYGSPSVFSGFEPHFSIFSSNIADNKKIEFNKDVNKIINSIKLTEQNVRITGIGIGEADINGQITKVIKLYKLKS